ncbi:MAG: histidine--tRNA ligase family protein [SAR202 cluster bacterium]|nr:histidine--tRNA ligase family protein [SAR202 cluster bacterium]
MPTTRDFPPQAWRRIVAIRDRLETFLDRRGYEPVATPTLEQTDLFLRKSGGELAAKMYSFTDPSGRRVSLRPEFTSSVVRSYVQGNLTGPLPARIQYFGTVFRYEAHDGGGLEFQQLGAELIGADGPTADAEAVALAAQALAVLGVEGHRMRLGHVGVLNAMFEALQLSERARVFIVGSFNDLRDGPAGMVLVRRRAAELGLLAPRRSRELQSLVRRLNDQDAREMVQGMLAETATGPTGQRTPEEVFMRYLKKLRDTEDAAVIERALEFASALAGAAGPVDEAMPKIEAVSAQYGVDAGVLDPLRKLLKALALYDLKGVPLILDFTTARGIAYYTGVVFELEHPRQRGAPSLGGGGRYNGLVKALGGEKDVPALGFAYAVDRVSELLPEEFDDTIPAGSTRVLVVAQETAIEKAVETAERLRAQGIPAELDLLGRSDVQAARYAQQRGIGTVMRVGRDGVTNEWAP